MIAFSILSEDVKKFRFGSPEKKDAGFLLHPKFWCFQKHAILHIFTFLFQKKILICYSRSPGFNMVLSFISLFEKDLYLTLF